MNGGYCRNVTDLFKNAVEVKILLILLYVITLQLIAYWFPMFALTH